MKKTIPYKIFVEAIKNSAGVITKIQKNLEEKGYKFTRKQLLDRIKEMPSILQCLEEEREKLKDKAEANIIQAIAEGDIKVSLEYLKRQAIDRGWGDESSLKLKGLEDMKIKINIIPTKDKKHK